MSITVELPEQARQQFVDLWGQSALSRKVLEALAIEAYREGHISRGKIGELLGLDFHQREAFLRERDVPYNYDLDDFQQDIQTLDRLRDESG